MATPQYGGKVSLGIAAEVTPGTFLAATAWIPNGKPMVPEKKPSRKAAKLAQGTAYADAFIYDGKGMIEFTIEVPLYPSLTSLFLTQAGITTAVAVGDPLATSITVSIPTSTSIQVAGCYVDTLEISGKADQPAMLKTTWKGILDPVLAATATPAYTFERAYQWKDAAAATLLGSATVRDIDDVMIKINHNLKPHYGNAGQSNPSHLIPGDREITGSFQKLHLSTTEIAKFYLAATVGSLSFAFANATPHSHTFAISNAAYITGNFDPQITDRVPEKYSFLAEAQAGVGPLICTIV